MFSFFQCQVRRENLAGKGLNSQIKTLPLICFAFTFCSSLNDSKKEANIRHSGKMSAFFVVAVLCLLSLVASFLYSMVAKAREQNCFFGG